MSQRRDVPPATVPIHLDGNGVAVEYHDGRRTRYDGPVDSVEPPVKCAPGKEVHVLVADPDTERGVLVYVNDRNTSADILADAGVGRVMLAPGEASQLVPGVVASVDGHSVVVETDPTAVDGRVFVFEEDEFGARAVELTGG